LSTIISAVGPASTLRSWYNRISIAAKRASPTPRSAFGGSEPARLPWGPRNPASVRDRVSNRPLVVFDAPSARRRAPLPRPHSPPRQGVACAQTAFGGSWQRGALSRVLGSAPEHHPAPAACGLRTAHGCACFPFVARIRVVLGLIVIESIVGDARSTGCKASRTTREGFLGQQ
jgi:hypothetical protein